MKGFVYVLFSLKDKRTYVGSTDDIERRINEHNLGKVKSTRDRRPLELIYTEEFDLLEEARRKEKYYKNCSGRKKLKVILMDKIK